MKYVASCSCGKDSLAMVLLLLERKAPLDCVVFFDAGKEFNAIYHNWEKLRVMLERAGVEAVTLLPPKSFDYYFSEHNVKTRDGSEKHGYSWCGGCTRWMTKIKTTVINKFYKEHYPGEVIAEYVGIAQDEPDRVKLERANNLKIYPLIYWGLSENDCLVKCYKAGFNWNENGVDLYQVLDRVSCFCCQNKNLKELRAIYKHLPQYWQLLQGLQNRTDKPYKDGKTVADLAARFAKE